MKKNDILIWVFVGVAVVVGGVAVLLLDGSGDSGSGLGDEFTYDVSEYGKTDAKLVMYEELPERFDTGMKVCKAIAVSGKKIYVGGDNKISVVGGKEIKLSGMPRDPNDYLLFDLDVLGGGVALEDAADEQKLSPVLLKDREHNEQLIRNSVHLSGSQFSVYFH